MSYESYMREVLGYTPSYMQDVYATNDYYVMHTNNDYMNNCNLEDLYPDTYKRIHPLVCRECNNNTMPITNEILEQMVDYVYNEIEIDFKVETNTKVVTKTSNTRETEDRQTRQRNNLLRDLIRILLLNELINQGRFPNGRLPFPPQRPPFPGGPTRPPMPGPGPRPPQLR